jgi:hypothetical protein
LDNIQVGILAPVPKLARYLSYFLKAGADAWVRLNRWSSLSTDGPSRFRPLSKEGENQPLINLQRWFAV